ncbi:MAG TPA: glycosyltransferase [Thermodesulfobacteriota bacterium]|nr:glycosyltransferase [Thermodesulfobacteriota bacterium]
MEQKGKTVQIERVLKWWDYPLFILLTAILIFAIYTFISYWLSLKDWLYYPATFVMITLMLLIILGNSLLRWLLLLYIRRPKPMIPSPSLKVGVATTFVPSAEPLDMLEDTLRALIALDYPHDTWVLDEGDNDKVKVLCQRLGAYHFSRKNLKHYQMETGPFQSHSKHGNYNAWLYETGFKQYEIISIFDPDQVPEAAFLSNVLGYFEDPKVSYVQVAQAYYNQKASFIARGAAEESYGFYSSIQMASYGIGQPSIIGCHSTHRVAALKEVGGLAPHDADDILLTLLYRGHGWKGVYVPKILARGLAPVDWNGYLTQQLRWARSGLDIAFRIHSQLSMNLPLTKRIISVLHGLNYLYKSFLIFTGLVILVFMLATGITPKVVSFSTLPRLAILCLAIQICGFYRQRFYLDWRAELGIHWRAVLLHYAKWPYMFSAFFDVILNRRVPYALTSKVKERPRYQTLLWPHILVVIFIGISMFVGLVSGHNINPFLLICAAIIVIISLALILTELLNFPDPYDRKLRNYLNIKHV